MNLQFTRDDIQLALSIIGRVKPADIELVEGLPSVIAFCKGIPAPKPSGRFRGAKVKQLSIKFQPKAPDPAPEKMKDGPAEIGPRF